ncbi:MAG TPA: glycosyltransferase, partial [Thermoanaerobaculia bacterium]|nr:glycosyltransferase [Thermoanaerobaculia bacterium]
ATNPVKAYEILAAGKPLVSVPLPEIARLGDLVRTAEGAEGFLAAIEAALAAESRAESDRRRAFASGETWGHRFAALAPAVAEAFPRASVVVVTHDNRELNRACLESLFARTEWPHLEVIAVDNGSADGTVELLADLAAQHPALTVLRNAENRGFAAAVNQGLAAATGELLGLLNNDTVVSRGWLTALAGHLRRDPSLGLVGASTNEIANEAKVPVGYASLDGMPEWARSFVRAHDGERDPIPMLAMFCVAMRRADQERVGPLDEGFEVGMFEDDDYGRRIEELGLRLAVARDAFVHHEGRASFARLETERYRAVFEKNRAHIEWKWGPWRPPMPQGVAEAHRAELAVRRERLGGEARRVVVFLPAVSWEGAAGTRSRELARAFARAGWIVLFDCTGSREDEFAGFLEPEPRLLLYRGHLDALAALPSPLLWARPCNAHFAGAWGERTVAYDLARELADAPCRPELREANHRRMLDEAAVVIGGAAAVAASLRRERADALELADAADDAGWDARVAAVVAALAASRRRRGG